MNETIPENDEVAPKPSSAPAPAPAQEPAPALSPMPPSDLTKKKFTNDNDKSKPKPKPKLDQQPGLSVGDQMYAVGKKAMKLGEQMSKDLQKQAWSKLDQVSGGKLTGFSESISKACSAVLSKLPGTKVTPVEESDKENKQSPNKQ